MRMLSTAILLTCLLPVGAMAQPLEQGFGFGAPSDVLGNDAIGRIPVRSPRSCEAPQPAETAHRHRGKATRLARNRPAGIGCPAPRG